MAYFGLKAIAAAFLLMLASAGLTYAAGPQEDVHDANQVIQRSIAAARQGDLSGARGAYNQYENTWSEIEDGVKGSSRDAYQAMEKAMAGVAIAFDAQSLDAERVVASLSALDREQQSFIAGQAPSSTVVTSPPTAGSNKPTVGTLLDLLGSARGDIQNGDYATATARLKTFESTWLDVEGDVKTRSADAYRRWTQHERGSLRARELQVHPVRRASAPASTWIVSARAPAR